MNHTKKIYRVDKFYVPEAAQSEFLARVKETHNLLRSLPGFIEDKILKQTGGPGRFNFVTIVVWESAGAIAAAKERVLAHHQAIGFHPQDMFLRLNIEADLGNYESLNA